MINWQERDFEDWLCSEENGEKRWRLWDVLGPSLLIDGPARAARQVDIGIGRIDILVWCSGYIAVIELKAHSADGNDLAQVLEYAAWIKARAQYTSIDGEGASPSVVPYLVAPSFGKRIQTAAAAAQVTLIEVNVEWQLEEIYGENEAVLAAYNDESVGIDEYIKEAFTVKMEEVADSAPVG